MALIFALKYPQYIEKLVLCGANLEPEGLKSGLRMKLRLRWAALQAAATCSRSWSGSSNCWT